jgi:BirA family transcriptional regulator, biotin operon repressor / biotin---[acetyl-CoA-carboxylase] ligase
LGLREFHEVLPSTQDRAIVLARSGAEEGTRVVARRQSQGRGRRGREWTSPEGGLYVSIVLATPAPPATLLPLGIGAFLASGLNDRYKTSLRVKWPNDLLAVTAGGHPRKVAGILVDSVASPSLGHAAVAGVGINVRVARDAYPAAIANDSASLHELLPSAPSVDDVEEIVAGAALAARRALAEPGGAARVRCLCEEMLYGVGRPVTVDGVRSGRISTLGDEGELLLGTGEDRHAVRSGEVRVEEEA